MSVKIHPGEIVYANAGRDKGKYFIVLSLENEFLYLCNGKSRKISNLKKKNEKHVSATGVVDSNISKKLSVGEIITDKQVRAVISKYKGELICDMRKE